MLPNMVENLFPLPDRPELSLWYRTWGNSSGIPVLFVHGGPGACVADYQDINVKFFNPTIYFVVEIDQRGTGKSQPSVRDGHQHMQHYLDIHLAQMSQDFEYIRQHLKISKWLVFGGSWGSTLGLDYCQRYPDVCGGLILRGIFLNTKEEHDAIYARQSFINDERRLKEFDIFFELASKECERLNETLLDPNDSQRFIQIYEKLILNGNRDAIWRFHVYENNLMEEDPNAMLDPHQVPDLASNAYREALSIAFFESRLFLRGTFETPINLLATKLIQSLRSIPVWICQGTGDEVCPEKFAQQLCAALDKEGVEHTDHFVASGHKASSNGMTEALILSVQEWYGKYGEMWEEATKVKEVEEVVEVVEEEEEEEDDMFGNLDELRANAAMDGVGDMPPDC